MFVINPNSSKFSDGTIAYIIGLDGSIITAQDYATGAPNNLINAKDHNLIMPFAKYKTNFHNQSVTAPQIIYVLNNQIDFDFPSTINIINPTNVATFFDLQSENKKTCYWVAFVTTYLPTTPTASTIPTAPTIPTASPVTIGATSTQSVSIPSVTPLPFKGTNISITANSLSGFVSCLCDKSGGCLLNNCDDCDDCCGVQDGTCS